MSTDNKYFFCVKSSQTNQNRSQYCCQEEIKEPTKLDDRGKKKQKFKSNTVLPSHTHQKKKNWLLFKRKGGEHVKE